VAKKTKEVVTITCDLCGNECKPWREIKIPVGSTPDFTNYIVLAVSGYFPYATANGDICRECLDKALSTKHAEGLLD
jgi:hypothetical protein